MSAVLLVDFKSQLKAKSCKIFGIQLFWQCPLLKFHTGGVWLSISYDHICDAVLSMLIADITSTSAILLVGDCSSIWSTIYYYAAQHQVLLSIDAHICHCLHACSLICPSVSFLCTLACLQTHHVISSIALFCSLALLLKQRHSSC